MPVKFALELEAINSDVKARDLRGFGRRWRNCGIMVYPDPNDDIVKTNIENIICKLDQEAQKILRGIWSDLLKKNRPVLRYQPLEQDSFTWETILSCDDLAEQKDKFDVALLEETRALELGIPDDQTKLFGEVQGLRFADTDVSKLEQPPSLLEPFRIRVGDRREDIWKRNFHDFAVSSQNVVIVDQYAVANKNIESIFWLLNCLKQNSRRYHVTIYSSVSSRTGNRQREKFAQEIKADVEIFYHEEIGKESGISVETRLYASDVTQKHTHDRHIRFDNHVIEIGLGLDIFKSEQVDRATDCHQKILPDGEKEGKKIALDQHPNRLILAFTLPESQP